MKRIILFVLLVCSISLQTKSQGLSFSYLIPKDGYLSAPVSPFSIRNVGLDFGLVGVETGFTLYSIGGLGMSGFPFETNRALTGPNFSLLVPLQLTLGVDTKFVSWKVKGGGFAIYHIDPRLNEGNLDREIREFEGWEVANSDMDLENNLGFGWMAGTSFEFHVSSKFSLTAGVSYLKGHSDAPLSGSYSGAALGDVVETVNTSYPDSQIDLEGIEVSIGVSLKN